jgi:hypothetical protein
LARQQIINNDVENYLKQCTYCFPDGAPMTELIESLRRGRGTELSLLDSLGMTPPARAAMGLSLAINVSNSARYVEYLPKDQVNAICEWLNAAKQKAAAVSELP